MNILLINHYAGSLRMGMEFRPYYLAREWAKLGHNVTIIGASYSHLRVNQPRVPKDFHKENIDEINYIWFKTPAYTSALKRAFNIFTFVYKLYIDAKKIARNLNPDVVINSSTYPLDIYPAKKIAKLANAKLIYEIHDLWPLSPMEIGGYSKSHPFIKVMQKAEDDCYKYSDKVISLLWNATEHIGDRNFHDLKFACIPNGYLKEEWDKKDLELPISHKSLFDTLHKENKLIAGYSGGHAPSTALKTLLDAATILKDNDKIAFVLVGKGLIKNDLIGYAKSRDLHNVYFLDSIDKVLISKLISNFDIAYMGGVHSVLHKYGTSFNKMTDYMLSSKPIIFSADEPNSLIERVGCGIRVDAENPRLVADVIVELLLKSKEELEIMGAKGEKYARENLEYSTLAKKFIDEIESI